MAKGLVRDHASQRRRLDARIPARRTRSDLATQAVVTTAFGSRTTLALRRSGARSSTLPPPDQLPPMVRHSLYGAAFTDDPTGVEPRRCDGEGYDDSEGGQCARHGQWMLQQLSAPTIGRGLAPSDRAIHVSPPQVERAMTTFADHDAYIAEAPEQLRPLLVRLRALLAVTLPDAEEVIAYNMPGFQDRAIDRRGLCRLQQAMRRLSVALRHRVACRRHCRGRTQVYQDRRHLLAEPANPRPARQETRSGFPARSKSLSSRFGKHPFPPDAAENVG